MQQVVQRTLEALNPASERLRFATYGAILLVVFTIPWQRLVLLDGVGTITRLIGLAAAGVAGLAVLSEGRRQRLVDAHILMILLTAWIATSVIWSIRPSATYGTVITVIQLLALAWMISEFALGLTRLRGVMVAYVLGAAVTAVIMVIQFRASAEGAQRFSVAETAHPNDIAFMLCLAIPMAWYLSLLSRRVWLVLALWATLPLTLFAILLTASRSALILLCVALLIVPLTWKRLDRSLRSVFLIGGVVTVAALMSVLPERPLERLSTIANGLTDTNFGVRSVLLESAWRTVGEYPLLGVGAGASRYQIQTYSGMQLGAHNSYLSVASELGLVGITLYVLMLLTVALRVLNLRGLERHMGLVLGLTLAVGLVPRHAEYDKAPWLVLALLVALSLPRNLASGRPGIPVLIEPPAAGSTGTSPFAGASSSAAHSGPSRSITPTSRSSPARRPMERAGPVQPSTPVRFTRKEPRPW